MEHAVLTREMISHATLHRKDLYMVQIDFSNAFGSIPHDLVLDNVYSLGLPTAAGELVRDIYPDNRSKIALTGGETEFIPWQSGTLQGCPLSPTFFNICLEGFLRRLEKDDMKDRCHCIHLDDGSAVKINAAAYEDDLILYSESHQDMEVMIWKHFPRVTNTTMELRAVLETLNYLPQGMKVLVSSDSQHARLGMLEWIHKWKRNGWKSAKNGKITNAE
jgi:hypothetical protein